MEQILKAPAQTNLFAFSGCLVSFIVFLGSSRQARCGASGQMCVDELRL
jgi:hypothetical protein